jgi:putative SOS response-associated peptidase YedK
MCGRYTLAKNPAALFERLAVREPVPPEPRYNIAPGSDLLAVTTDRDGVPRIEQLRWGLVPGWAKDPAIGFKMINARSETLAEKPVYKMPLQRTRCVIPADGFYEWQAREGQQKLPFHVTRTDGATFAFAGLWSVWRRGEPDELRTCTIITTAANARMATVHTRMPAILEPGAETEWLDPATPIDALKKLLHGLSADETQLRPVSFAVNDARHDRPDCLDDPAPDPAADQGTLFA